MDKLTRLFKLHQLMLSHRHPIPMRELQARLECSRATVARGIEELRLYFGAPLEYVRDGNGYAYTSPMDTQLPGLWLSEQEILALLTLKQIVDDIGPGILAAELKPISDRMRKLLESLGVDIGQNLDRIKLGAIFQRPMNDKHFASIAEATVRRRQLAASYCNRSDGSTNVRTVSPQRMVFYRNNWYVEAWCHTRNDLRTFALDRFVNVRILEQNANEISAEILDARFEDSYGIFSGEPTAWAVLRFSRWQANWTAAEKWHPDQIARTLEDGRYEISIPYSRERELIIDILGHVPHVEVISPPALRQEVKRRLAQGLSMYRDDNDCT